MNVFKKVYCKGQALIEYILLLVFIVGITIKLVGTFSDFFRDSLGNLGHVMTLNLFVGVCENDCLFPGFQNGPKE